MRDDMDKVLRQAHAPAGEDDAAHRAALLEELQARHRLLHPRRQRWKIMTHKIWFRPVMTAVALMVLGIAACTTPTEYDVDMGKQLTMTFDNAAKAEDLEQSLQYIVQYIQDQDGVDNAMVNIQEQDGGPLTAGITVWGQNLDAAALEKDLLAEFPILATAEVSISNLEGTVEGSLAEWVGFTLFDIEVDAPTAEEVREQILLQLAAQGFTGDAQVEIIDGEDGERRVNIELNDIVVEEGLQADDEGKVIVEFEQE